jgi:hypothetical protein
MKIFSTAVKKLNLIKINYRNIFIGNYLKPNNLHSALHKKFCEKVKSEENLMKEFENLLESGENDQEKRVKLLSIKLLSLSSSNEVLNFFEEKYIKGQVSNIYGEEILLLIYFYTTLLEKESIGASRLHLLDNRFNKYIEMLKDKVNELDLNSLVALVWSLSILISKFNFTVPLNLRHKIFETLPNELETEKKGEIPTICFSLSMFIELDR